MQGFAEEFGFKMDDVIIHGTGSSQPLSILSSQATVTVVKETSQASKTIQVENILKIWSRCWGRSRENAVWFINQDVEPQLFALQMTIGDGGVTVYMPANGLAGQPYSTLFGRPIIPLEQCSTLGTKGDIILADLSQYLLIDKGSIKYPCTIPVRRERISLYLPLRWPAGLEQTPYPLQRELDPVTLCDSSQSIRRRIEHN